MPIYCNLLRRSAKPALNRGRVQRGALRALWALNGEATTSEVAEWTHVRARAYGERSDNHTRAARRVLARIAAKVRRWRRVTHGCGEPATPIRIPGSN
jgi:hypothetical protein